jgi:hypothetical protein
LALATVRWRTDKDLRWKGTVGRVRLLRPEPGLPLSVRDRLKLCFS